LAAATATLSGLDLIDQLRGTHTIVIPVLSSYLDTHVTADFIRDLYLTAKVRPENTRICIVCNRVKSNTLAFRALQRFLDSLDIPLIGELRETQNYVKASDSGLGVHELKSHANEKDIEDWNKILTWLDSDIRHKDLKFGLRTV
jgi:chromosome partitioning protein